MRFAYYIPALPYNEATDEKLVELGLGDRFCDCFGRLSHEHICRSQIHARGPDGSSGAWLYPKGADNLPALKWNPAEWESQLSDNGKFYLCWQKGAKAEPELLKRRKIVEGKEIELLDGRVWHCPTIRKRLGIPNVPCCYQRTSGTVKREVVPSFKGIWEASGEWAAQCFGSGLTEVALVDIATRCLAINYRVGDEELRMLSLFDFDAMLSIFKVAVDFDAVAEMFGEKKSPENSGQPNDTNSSPGEQESTQGTEFRAAS